MTEGIRPGSLDHVMSLATPGDPWKLDPDADVEDYLDAVRASIARGVCPWCLDTLMAFGPGEYCCLGNGPGTGSHGPHMAMYWYRDGIAWPLVAG
jgi:hypothetical protein